MQFLSLIFQSLPDHGDNGPGIFGKEQVGLSCWAARQLIKYLFPDPVLLLSHDADGHPPQLLLVIKKVSLPDQSRQCWVIRSRYPFKYWLAFRGGRVMALVSLAAKRDNDDLHTSRQARNVNIIFTYRVKRGV